jgi:Protein of unknown function (DUF3311)
VTEPDNGSSSRPPRRSDHSPWNWLLLAAVIVPLLSFLYNHDRPRLLGLPMFYWLQMAFILLGVGSTTLVYQVTKRRR